MNLIITIEFFDFNRTGHEEAGVVHVKQIYEIAKIKQTDSSLKNLPLEVIARMLCGQAGTMGIRIVDDNSPKTIVLK